MAFITNTNWKGLRRENHVIPNHVGFHFCARQVATQSGLEEAMRRGLQQNLVVSVGPISTEALLAHGIAPDMEPAHPKMGQLVYEAAEKAKALLNKKRAEFV